ncbi:hypothetical protein B0H13DRAFT_2354016 [Mycena leptocephala]|nr:hypothetical protein B0H13DRAFT_2354016 [Mycena leptocephala]
MSCVTEPNLEQVSSLRTTPSCPELLWYAAGSKANVNKNEMVGALMTEDQQGRSRLVGKEDKQGHRVGPPAAYTQALPAAASRTSATKSTSSTGCFIPTPTPKPAELQLDQPHGLAQLRARADLVVHDDVDGPPVPKTDRGQTVFLFNSLLPNASSAIMQPVLQYGPSDAGGGTYNNHNAFTPPIPTTPATTLNGIIALASSNGSTLNYNSQFTGIPGTSLNVDLRPKTIFLRHRNTGGVRYGGDHRLSGWRDSLHGYQPRACGRGGVESEIGDGG